MPGSSRPSMNSSEAPPPVEMCVIFEVRPELLQRGDRVAATDDHGHALLRQAGELAADRARAIAKGRYLENTQRAVPEDRLGRLERSKERLRRVRSDINRRPRVRDLVDLDDLVLGARA